MIVASLRPSELEEMSETQRPSETKVHHWRDRILDEEIDDNTGGNKVNTKTEVAEGEIPWIIGKN